MVMRMDWETDLSQLLHQDYARNGMEGIKKPVGGTLPVQPQSEDGAGGDFLAIGAPGDLHVQQLQLMLPVEPQDAVQRLLAVVFQLEIDLLLVLQQM